MIVLLWTFFLYRRSPQRFITLRALLSSDVDYFKIIQLPYWLIDVLSMYLFSFSHAIALETVALLILHTLQISSSDISVLALIAE